MKKALLNIEVQKFINDSLSKNVSSLALQKNPFSEIPYSSILQQIEAKQRSKSKLPTWFNALNILYPSKLSIEQTSSETCASYKASLVSGNNLIDLTGGFGIDSFYFSKNFKEIIHCEIQAELSEIVSHNFKILNAANITCITTDSLDYLKRSNRFWDCIYVDPARRNQTKEKVFFLRDCTPNVPELLDEYFKYCNTILIKTAPLLDIQAGISELKNVKEIHIIALSNEVKELLWVLKKDYQGDINIIASNLHKETINSVKISLNDNSVASFSEPLKYLYEPNAALMKSGKFDYISTYYDLKKLHQHTHLYSSDKLIPFPGRIFEIKSVVPFNKKNTKTYLSNFSGNITTRNFPMKVEDIRKKWKIKDGGSNYLFFTTNNTNEKIMIFCKKTD